MVHPEFRAMDESLSSQGREDQSKLPTAKRTEKLVPKKGDPPLTMVRLEEYATNPSEENKRFAVELLEILGPLVLDKVHYQVKNGDILTTPVEFLGMDRQRQYQNVDRRPDFSFG